MIQSELSEILDGFTPYYCADNEDSIEAILTDREDHSLHKFIDRNETPKFDEKTGSHIRVKKAIYPKDGTIFDFMICPPNDESEVIDNSLLCVLKPNVKRHQKRNNNTNGFKARPADMINSDIINPILWYTKNIISEDYLMIEHKGLESKVIKDYAGFMVTSNYDAPLQIEIGDHHIHLDKALEHPDVPSVVIAYLISFDLSNWSPQEIPFTKIKVDLIYEQLPNLIRFIIDYVAPWSNDNVARPSRTLLYQNYFECCRENREKPLSSKVAEKKFSQIGIESKQAQVDGNIKEFSDTPQPNLPENAEKNLPSSNKKVDNQDNVTQALFDYVVEETKAPVASISGTSKTSKMSNLPEPKINKRSQKGWLETSKLSEPIKLISRVAPDTPSKETDYSKPVNEISFAILLIRAQHEKHLRKRAIKLSEDSDKFMTITEKDRLDFTGMAKKYKHTSEEHKHAPKLDALLPDWMTRRYVKVTLARGTNNRCSFSKEQIEALLSDKRKKKLTIEERTKYCAKIGNAINIFAYHLDLGPKNDYKNEIVATRVLKRIQNMDVSKIPSKEDLMNVIVMLSMRPAKYKKGYSWYYVSYLKSREEKKKNPKPRPFLSMEKSPEYIRELLTWIQNAIKAKKLDYRSKHAFRIHGGKKPTSQHLKLLLRITMRQESDRLDASDNYVIGDTELEESNSEPETDNSLKPQIQTSLLFQRIEINSMLAEIDAMLTEIQK
ncbi:8542_t:CDS:10 [Cetraspora pellucida]|uniref:8542_t:CDS:1 n=1 Tax=Cetraspora pellucida TaxID=1433469 RepID=A0A9N9F8Y5_9GLOM|nr:8542_t:CDS:10 [Cetraspora pellucida]